MAMDEKRYFQWISKIIKLSSWQVGRQREREIDILKMLLGLLKASIKRIRN